MPGPLISTSLVIRYYIRPVVRPYADKIAATSLNNKLTFTLLTTTIVAPPSNASKWQMGFNSAFKRLMNKYVNRQCSSSLLNVVFCSFDFVWTVLPTVYLRRNIRALYWK